MITDLEKYINRMTQETSIEELFLRAIMSNEELYKEGGLLQKQENN